jgi:hypothetical protein
MASNMTKPSTTRHFPPELFNNISHQEKFGVYLEEIGWGSVDWIGMVQDRNQ